MLNPIQKILNTKFRNKLILMCIVAIVPVTIAGIILLYNLIDLMRANTENEALFEADGLKTRLKDTVATVSNIGDRIFESYSFGDIVNNDLVNDDEYYNFYMQNQSIPEYLSVYPQIDSVSFYLNKEDFLYNNYFLYADEEVRNLNWYKSAESSKALKWQLISYEDGYRLTLVRPIIDDEENFCGAMLISVDPAWFDELTSETQSRVVFSIGSGIIFYSKLDSYRVGTILNGSGSTFPAGISDSEVLNSGTHQFEKIGYTVVSYFDYENSGNQFQVYIVRPSAIFNSITQNAVFTYIWNIFLCIVLSVLLTILFSSVFSRRIQFLKDQMHSAAAGDFELAEDIKGTDEIYDLYIDLKKMVDSMQELINDAYKAKIRSETFKLNQIEAEFKTLASQINPHFLYNTLETIRMKAYCNDDKETADLVKKLGKFMRRCLEVKDGMVTLESELEFTRSYLELQSARFGDRISYSIYCEVSRDYMILPLIIQPIVENAFAHGIESAKSNGKITINVRYKGDKIEISVSDNGQGMTLERLRELLAKLKENDTSSGKSIGLTNVNKRVKMYHGDEYGLSVKTAVGNGTTIIIDLPRVVDENVMKRLPEKYSEISENISSKINHTGMKPRTE